MKKKLSVLILATMIMLTTCSCIIDFDKVPDSEVVEIMKNTVEEKYSEEFELEYFLRARDHTYTDILTLSKGDLVFNVYHEPEDVNFEEIWDDYVREIMDDKVKEAKFGGECENINFDIGVMYDSSKGISVEDVKPLSGEQILENYDCHKLICVVNVKSPFEDSTVENERVYEIYNQAVSIAPEMLEFEVVYSNGKTERKLERAVTNIKAYYENGWEYYSTTLGYISTKDIEISSKEDFFALYEDI